MAKRGLGRGLAMLLPEAADIPQGQVREIDISEVLPNPYQPRTLFDPVALEELVQSIREHGVLQPILVRETESGKFEVVAGERRLRAAQRAGLTRIPAMVRSCSDREMLEVAIVENLQREDITPIEAAKAYLRMMREFGLTQEQVAQRVGKTRTAIANALRLLQLPEEVQESIERGEITEGHGRALMMAERPDVILRLWTVVKSRGLSVRETERLAKASRHSAAPPSVSASSSPDPQIQYIQERLQGALKTRVSLHYTSSGAGRIEIFFYSLDELERLLDLLVPQEG
ncbi:ParB/RepB/Spo0J family partition protein [Chthonomonas calidirosea]|uniref:ParB/RepB/Spo0J family partition protein n=1 Tax=Chthonomonas calidirosea TaxID=454171 RepID=UPI0006EC84C6|nr:ParB/RepB/Spo0J family partition protein [Chthonomonas calidirosea]CEK18461.1 chromosome segregation DNA-binding protein [Chthonomonas calidirosea]